MKFFRRCQPELTAEDVEREIQLAIDEAWEVSRNDPAIKAQWDRYFPNGKKPSQEEFLRCLAQKVREDKVRFSS